MCGKHKPLEKLCILWKPWDALCNLIHGALSKGHAKKDVMSGSRNIRKNTRALMMLTCLHSLAMSKGSCQFPPIDCNLCSTAMSLFSVPGAKQTLENNIFSTEEFVTLIHQYDPIIILKMWQHVSFFAHASFPHGGKNRTFYLPVLFLFSLGHNPYKSGTCVPRLHSVPCGVQSLHIWPQLPRWICLQGMYKLP